MWTTGDTMRAAYLFVLIGALWPAGNNALVILIRRLWLRRVLWHTAAMKVAGIACPQSRAESTLG
jgi:hypothetical protein